MELTSSDREFLVDEVEQVRKDYQSLIEETRRLERYAIVVVGATWSWCASNTDNFAFSLLVWFPAAAVTLFGLRAAAIHVQARAARHYLVKVEHALGLPNELGWGADQNRQSGGIPAVVAITAYAFWAVVSIGTVVVPLIMHAHAATERSQPSRPMAGGNEIAERAPNHS
jgi:hypothetical protein